MRLETRPRTAIRLRINLWGAITVGVALMSFGAVAIALPLAGTSVSASVLSVLLSLSGIARFIHTMQTARSGQFGLKLFISLLCCMAGLILWNHSLPRTVVPTLVLGLTLLLKGSAQTILAFQLKPLPHWDWVLFSSIVGVVLGTVICHLGVVSNVAFLGVLLGLDLSLDGLWIVMMSVAVYRFLE